MKKFLSISLISIGIFLFISRPVSADVGPPPIFSQGGILQTDVEDTNVAMKEENVVLRYGEPRQDEELTYMSVMPVHVTATFVMENTGKETETLSVYFPSNDAYFAGGDIYGLDQTLIDFTVDGQQLGEDSLTHLQALINGQEQSVPVYQWEHTFLPGQETTLTVSYDSKSAKEYGVFYLTYVLGTGRGWHDSIGNGTITFELPENLADYSVVDQAPLLGKNVLPFTVEDNTIKLSFQNYEPEPDAVIALGVCDPELVKRAEALKQEVTSFENTFELADIYRRLSIGAHCAFCTGKTADLAKTYYMEALNQASTENELDRTLTAFMFGTGDSDWSPDIEDAKALFAFPNCAAYDTACRYDSYYDRGAFGDTPFRFDSNTQTIEQTDFLELYLSKIRPFNPEMAGYVEKYLEDAPLAYKWYAQEYDIPEVTENNNANTNTVVNDNINSSNLNSSSQNNNSSAVSDQNDSDNNNRNWLIIGLGLVVIALILGYVIIRTKTKAAR